MIENDNKRSEYIDIIKGLLIFLVVVGHVIQDMKGSYFTGIYNYIYSFHMPLFIFISGLLAKKAEKQRDKAIVDLLGIYLIMSVFYTSEYIIFDHNGLNYKEAIFRVILSPFNAAYGSWYILSLIAWRLITPYISKIRHVLILSILVALLAGMIDGIGVVMSLSRTIAFYPFYLAGYFMDISKLHKVTYCRNYILKLLWIPAALLTVVIVDKIGAAGLWMSMPYSAYGYGALHGILSRFLIFILTLINSCLFLLFINGSRSKVLSNIGKNSFNIYLGSEFLVIPINFLLRSQLLALNQYVLLIISLLVSTCITIMLSNNFTSKFISVLQGRIKSYIWKNTNDDTINSYNNTITP